MNKKLYEYLKSEEEATFTGWNFSRLNSRWKNECLMWDYKTIVKAQLKQNHKLLDMGTGGGEFLLSFNHPYKNTSVTEGYKPNYKLCLDTLRPLGINVISTCNGSDYLNFKDNSFDIIINRHESFSINEVKRILKPNGLFISQQVGEDNGASLRKYLIDDYKKPFEGLNLTEVSANIESHNFEIQYANEYFPYMRFMDVGAIVYYAKTIKWEFPNFSVDTHYDKLVELNKQCQSNGYIETNEHRFIIVCKNIK